MGCRPIRNMDIMQTDTQLFRATLALACATCDTFMWVYVESSGHLVGCGRRRPVNADEEALVSSEPQQIRAAGGRSRDLRGSHHSEEQEENLRLVNAPWFAQIINVTNGDESTSWDGYMCTCNDTFWNRQLQRQKQQNQIYGNCRTDVNESKDRKQ